MELINNITYTLRDDLEKTVTKKSKLRIAAACFSIYAYEELKKSLSSIEDLRFIFTSPTFTTDKAEKSKREFYIPRITREKNLYGSEFEIRLRNELMPTQQNGESIGGMTSPSKCISNPKRQA